MCFLFLWNLRVGCGATILTQEWCRSDLPRPSSNMIIFLLICLTLLLEISNACWRANACRIITFLMEIMDFGWKFYVFWPKPQTLIWCEKTKTPNPDVVWKQQNPKPWGGVKKPKPWTQNPKIMPQNPNPGPQTPKSCQKTKTLN